MTFRNYFQRKNVHWRPSQVNTGVTRQDVIFFDPTDKCERKVNSPLLLVINTVRSCYKKIIAIAARNNPVLVSLYGTILKNIEY